MSKPNTTLFHENFLNEEIKECWILIFHLKILNNLNMNEFSCKLKIGIDF